MGKTVLIVEDEKAIVEILKFNLQREGYAVLEALDGEAGLELAQTRDPDLVLLDVMLPRMNGFDVCRTLREAGYAVPIIMLTAREEENDKVMGLESGADDYITKPGSRPTSAAAAWTPPPPRPRPCCKWPMCRWTRRPWPSTRPESPWT